MAVYFMERQLILVACAHHLMNPDEKASAFDPPDTGLIYNPVIRQTSLKQMKILTRFMKLGL